VYCFAIALALLSGIWWRDHRAQFQAGYAAAIAAEQAAVIQYQKLLVAQKEEDAKKLAELVQQHTIELQAIEDEKANEIAKTRTIVHTIVRPDSCNLTDIELRDFNEVIGSTNSTISGSGKGPD
jgi:hypothetical protein